jgi:hypothetical protein
VVEIIERITDNSEFEHLKQDMGKLFYVDMRVLMGGLLA